MDYQDDMSIYGNYTFTYKGRTLSSHREWARRPIIANGQKVFCLDVFNEKIGASYSASELRAGVIYNQFGDVLSEEQVETVKRIIFWGWAMNSWTSKNYFYTQIYVWETCGYKLVSLSDAFSMSEYNAFKKSIDNHMSQTVSFSGSEYSVKFGESLTLTDTNANLQYLEFVDKNGWDITQSGNTITFTPTVNATECTISTQNVKLHKYAKINIILSDGVHQKTVLFRDPDFIKANITLKPIKYDKIQICKVDENDVPVPHTKFITSYNEDFSGETWIYETGEDGYTRNVDGWDIGKTVYIKEIEVPKPYVLSKEVKTVKITGGESHKIKFINKKQKGKIRIVKTGEKLSYDKKTILLDEKETDIYEPVLKFESLAGVTFEIYKDNKKVATVITDEKGIAEIENLELGKYKIIEVKTLDGYVLDKKERYVEFTRENQEIEVDIKTTNINNKLIKNKVKLIKKQLGYEDVYISDVLGGIYNEKEELVYLVKSDETGEFKIYDVESGQLNKNKEIILAYGKYFFIEMKEKDGYLKNDKKYEFEVLKDKEEIVIEIENEKIPEIISKATGEKEEKEIYETDNVKEVVEIKDLMKGYTYKILAKMINKTTGEVISMQEREFVANEETEILEFIFNANSLEIDKLNYEIVMIDELYRDEKLISSHTDLENKEQTVVVYKQPTIISKATGEKGTKEIYETEKIKEVVEISNLIKGNTYKIIAKMINKATGEVISIQEREFIANEEIETIEFIFNVKGLSGKTIVMTDELYKDGKLISNHTDLENKEQTVKIKENPIPKTGVDGNYMYMLLLGVSLVLFIVLYRKTNKI